MRLSRQPRWASSRAPLNELSALVFLFSKPGPARGLRQNHRHPIVHLARDPAWRRREDCVRWSDLRVLHMRVVPDPREGERFPIGSADEVRLLDWLLGLGIADNFTFASKPMRTGTNGCQ
jgi:hypothetical protein